MTGTFTVYDLVLICLFLGGVVERLIAWRAARKLKAKVETLLHKHPTEGDDHQAVPSPPDEIVAGRPNPVPKEIP